MEGASIQLFTRYQTSSAPTHQLNRHFKADIALVKATAYMKFHLRHFESFGKCTC